MSETSGRCRSEMEEATGPIQIARVDLVLADAIDRLAADVAALKEARRCAMAPDEPRADTVERQQPPAVPQPAAPPAGWLTEEERAVVEVIASKIELWSKMAWSDIDEKRCAVLRSILSRAGSPPVVEVPEMVFGSGSYATQKAYRAAMDKAGVAWKEVGRE